MSHVCDLTHANHVPSNVPIPGKGEVYRLRVIDAKGRTTDWRCGRYASIVETKLRVSRSLGFTRASLLIVPIDTPVVLNQVA